MTITNEVILVTGGAGFVGSNLVRRLVKSNNKVHLLLKATSNTWRLEDIKNRMITHYQDLENINSLRKLVHNINPHIIYHLAAHGAYSTQTDTLKMIHTNIIGTANLINSLENINYKCFINTGSSSEYGFKEKPMKESDQANPNSVYAVTKLATSHLCQVLAKSHNKPIITFRLFSVYGPYEEPSRLIPTLVKNTITNRPIALTKNKAMRDFIYIDDVINVYIKAIQMISKKLYGETFNIGTGKQHSNEDITRTVFEILNKKVPIETGNYKNRSWDSEYWVADIEKTTKLLHWHSIYGLKEGLKKTVDWFKTYKEFKKIYDKRDR